MKHYVDVLFMLKYNKMHKNVLNCHALVYVKALKIIHYNTFKTN